MRNERAVHVPYLHFLSDVEMGLPVARAKLAQKVCSKIKALEKSSIASKFVAPFFLACVPSVLVYLGRDPIVVKKIGELIIPTFLKAPLSILILAILSGFAITHFLKAFWDWVGKTADSARKISREDLNFILTVFETIVDFKLSRIRRFYKDNLLPLGASKCFQGITKPELQIDALIAGLQGVFQHLYPLPVFRCALMRVEGGLPVEWIAAVGSSPRTPPELLQNVESTMMRCIKSHEIFIVEDVESELRKPKDRFFVEGNVGTKVSGGQLCYPVLDKNSTEVLYVISVSCSVAATVEDVHTDLIKWIMDHFSKRLLLEHYLLKLKQRTNENSTKSRKAR